MIKRHGTQAVSVPLEVCGTVDGEFFVDFLFIGVMQEMADTTDPEAWFFDRCEINFDQAELIGLLSKGGQLLSPEGNFLCTPREVRSWARGYQDNAWKQVEVGE